MTPEEKRANKLAYMKQWREDNKEHRAAYQREKKFGLTSLQYDAMLAAQDFKCAVCMTADPGLGRGWHVDHCHTKGHVRGLLCNSCNVGLGHFRDSPEILSNAIEYLKRTNVG